MDGMGLDMGSDFVTNFAFVPPSPPQIESVFDYPAFDSAELIITSPPLPHTFSYNGLTILPIHSTHNCLLQATISSCKSFQIP